MKIFLSTKLALLILFLGACQRKSISICKNQEGLKQLSIQLEQSASPASVKNTNIEYSSFIISKEVKPNTLSHNRKSSWKEVKEKKQLSSPSTKHDINKKKPSQKTGDAPFNFKKHDNIFWKIGGGILTVGIAILVIFLTLLFKIVQTSGSFLLGGLLLGLALMVLSLPFILLGAIIGSC